MKRNGGVRETVKRQIGRRNVFSGVTVGVDAVSRLRGRRGGGTRTARVRDAGWFDTALRGVNLDSNARGPADHELLGRGAYVPLVLSPTPPLYVRRPVDLEPISSSA